ncbi:hypothetical protein GUJ93_ZPchr0028g29036 [Zizania palustris]|uniref:DUF674 family protein n=1 Tax=Zizania palustris TaxID=103762 RepID=A0A8J5R3Z7_ZIZPA|nr:hypothetical protein GUJ93_ZPchr0028g29036 [Zizania palustris]
MSATNSEGPTVAVKLFVDKERSKVLFAESDCEFVDVLFGFLTLPLGSVVRLFGEQHRVGCLDQVFKIVEGLDTDYFHSTACKTMLLRPLNAAADLCDKLKVKIDTNPRAVYVCKNTRCFCSGGYAITLVDGSICSGCGKVRKYIGQWPQDPDNTAAASSNGVFVKGFYKFIITDDLEVAPASTSIMVSLLDKFGVRNPAFLEHKIIQLNAEKIISLLKRSLSTKQALTEYYFNAPISNDDSHLYVLPDNLYSKRKADVDNKLTNVKINIVQTKSNLSLLYAEVGDDFINLLLGLLSIPLGSFVRTYGKSSSNGCVDSIYRSIDGCAKRCMSPQCQILLQSPKVAPFFGSCTSNMLEAEEAAPREKLIDCCFGCFKTRGFSGYVRLTASKVMSSQIPSNDLMVNELTLTKAQVKELLRAAVVTRNILSSVLLPPRKKP